MTHVHRPEAIQRIIKIIEDGTPTPTKITEHKQRMEAVIAAADRRHQPKDILNEEEIECLIGMKMEFDSLYSDWVGGIKRIRWIDIPEQTDITPDDVVRESMLSTESYFGNTGVEVLAAYLDACGYDNLLYKLGEACVFRTREYLEGIVPWSTETIAVLDNPAEHFGTNDEQILRNKLFNYFVLFVNSKSQNHVKRAIIANFEWGLGNIITAIEEAGFAYCESTVENFGVKLELMHPDVDKPLREYELWKAEQLLGFLK
ncbi:hypothetical protein KC723_01770 [Candidatus Kaiserbacteria bacterium]|nr:hypothetical protein [Candidatus Kaiserbacteria bacterium]